MIICSGIEGFEKEGKKYRFQLNGAEMLVSALTDEIFRVKVSFGGGPALTDYVLESDAINGSFLPEAEESAEKYVISTKALRLEACKDPFCLKLFDVSGDLLYSSVPGLTFLKDNNLRVSHYSCMEEDACFYGFGEKGGELNKNGSFIREKATDSYSYSAINTDTLYKHIPFYIVLSRKTKKALGVFYNNYYESEFNMGREISNYLPRYTYWRADGGDIDLFLLGGGKISRIIDNYTYLTGRPALLPKRALGYQGSSMYYSELERGCDKAIESFADTAQSEGIRLSGFHLSSGYTAQDGKRCVFTWNEDRFGDPDAFFKKMREKGAEVVPNVKPGVLLSHPYFERYENAFVKSGEDKKKPGVVPWWGGKGALWDFTDPEARKLWKDELKEKLIRLGTDSVWNDNCEYDSLACTDAVCSNEGNPAPAAGLRALMANLMCRSGFEAVIEENENARPYMVCRSGAPGIQKYAQTWCGDNSTSWETLKYNIPMITGMGLSGQPNEGADIGGFAGPAPDEELFVRWVQSGIFQPRFSIHSASSDNTVTEPWMFSASKDRIRKLIDLRYRLMPYLYSLEYEAHLTGAPVMRALVYEFQGDESVFDESFEFMSGKDLLVANVLEPGAKTGKVYLPAGCRWFDANDRFRAYEGGQSIEVPVTLDTIPLFVRDGAIIPYYGETENTLELLLAPGRDSSFTLYEDDGVTNGFEKGVFRKTNIEMSGDESVKVLFRAEGTYKDSIENIHIEMIKKERCPYRVALDGRKLEHFLSRTEFEKASEGWYYSSSKRSALIKYDNPKKDAELLVSFEDLDLIGM